MSLFLRNFVRVMKMQFKLTIISVLISIGAIAQCPQVFDYEGNATVHPYWYDCDGGSFDFNLQSPQNWPNVEIHWGDGTTNTIQSNWSVGSPINHTYAPSVDTFVVTISNLSGCIITGVVVMEQAASASIQIPVGGITQGCAPQAMDFINSSTNVSATTQFQWDFGDNSPDLFFDAQNSNQSVSHLYEPGTVSCETVVTLYAENYCNTIQGGASIATFNPIRIWDKDLPQITTPFATLCYPDTIFSFTNNAQKNCFTQGNIFQRQEKWNFGDYWGSGIQETDWIPFPPNLPQTVAFPGIGDYIVSVQDSNYCGIQTDDITVHIISPPIADFTISQDTVCVGQNITFFPTSTGANQHFWNLNGNWTSANGGNMNFSFNSPGVFYVSYRVAQSLSPTSCSDTVTKTVVVLAAPTTQIITANASACDSLHVELSQNSTGNPILYDWTLLDGNTFSGSTPAPFDITNTGNFTITLQVTASNGCTATDTQILQVVNTPTAQFSNLGNCQNSNISFINESGGPNTPSHWNFGDGQSSNAFSPNHIYALPGDYTIELIAGITGCQDTIENTITVDPLPLVQFTVNDNVGCTPFGVSFNNNSVGISSQIWTFGDNTSSTDLSPSHVFLTSQGSSSNFTVTLSGTSDMGCSATANTLITVNSGAFASFIDPNSVPECSPHTSAFINNSQAAVSYLWDFGDGNTSTEFAPTHVYENNTTLVGFFTASLIAYSTGECHDTTEQTIVVFPSATFNIDFNSFTGCSPVEIPMPLLTGAAEFHWIFGDGAESFEALPTHIYQTTLPIDTFEVSFIGTSVFGCTDTTHSSVIILGGPTASFSIDHTDGCEPASVVFYNNSSNVDSYQWNFQDGNISNTSDTLFTHVFEQEGDFLSHFNIELVATSSNGCTDTSTTLYTLHPQAIAQFNPSLSAACAPFNCLFQNNSSGATQFQWDLGDGTSTSVISPSHTYQNLITQDSTYTVSLIAANDYGCSDTLTTAIVVHRTPVAYFDMIDTTGCYPLTITFENGSVGADQYSWNYGTGQTSINAEPIHQHNFFNLTNVAVTNAVVLAAMTTDGCFSTYTMPVTVPPGITANFTGDLEGCHPFNTLLLNQSIGAQSYHWDFGDGQTSTLFNPAHTYLNPNDTDTSYIVTLTATNALGCSQIISQQVQVFPVPLAQFTASPNPQTWPNAISIENNSISNSSTSYLWDMGNGNLLQQENPGNFNYNTWGNYNIIMIANNGQCSDTAYQAMTILAPDPVAGFIGDKSGCAPLTVAFQDTSQYGNGWLWEFGDGGASINTSPVHIYDTPGLYTVRQIVIGYNGQIDTAVHPLSIEVFPRAIAIFTVTPPQVTIPQQPVYIVNLSENANYFEWNFQDGDTSMSFAPQHTYTEPGLYDIQLIVNNEFNCPDTAVQIGAVNAIGGGDIVFPNAFSPLNTGPTDGRFDMNSYDNNVFFPKFEGIKNYELQIFDKWGEILFFSDDIYKGWDGYYKGVICPQDVYIWKAKGFFQNGQSYEYSGTVTLVRK